MRDPEDYNLWRIKESINYPAPNISRDKLIPELFRFKNKPDKLIIIYLEDERKGTQYAQLFFEKGYENVFLLTGGIEQFLEEFPELCEGESVPKPKTFYKRKFFDTSKTTSIEEEEKKKAEKEEKRKKKHESCLRETH